MLIRVRKASVVIGSIAFAMIVLIAGMELLAQKKKPRGRLPAYFSQIVTQEQRETIYNIQAKYTPDIKKLEAQIASIKAQRDGEILDLLTDEQKQKLAELRDKRKRKSKTKKKAKTSSRSEE